LLTLGRLCADKAHLLRKISNSSPSTEAGRPYISIKKNVVRIRAKEGLECLEGDACHVPAEQEALQDVVSSEKPGEDGSVDIQEEVQPHTLLEEEKGTDERAEAQSDNVQPIHNRRIANPIKVT